MTIKAYNNMLNPFECKTINTHKTSDLDTLANQYIGEGVFCLPVVNGEFIDDWSMIVTPDDDVQLISHPLGGDDGGSKDGLRTLFQIALVAAVSFAAGPIAGALGFTAGTAAFTAASSLIRAGLMFVGGIAINALLPVQQKAADNLKSLSPQNNVARIGQPMGHVLGEFIVYPDMIAAPYTKYVKNKPSLEEYFHFTNGYGEVSKERLGTTDISSFEEVSSTIAPNGISMPLRFVIPEASGVELLAPQDDDKTVWGTDEGWTQWFNVCPPYERIGTGYNRTFFEVTINFPKGMQDFGNLINDDQANGEHYDYLGGFEIEFQPITDTGADAYTPYRETRPLKIPNRPDNVQVNADYTTTIKFITNDYQPSLGVGQIYEAGQMSWPFTTPTELRCKFRIRRTVSKDEDASDESIAKIVSAYGRNILQKSIEGVNSKLVAGQMKRLPINGGQTYNAIVKRHIHTFEMAGSNYAYYDSLKFSNTCAQVIFHLLYELFDKDFNKVREFVDLQTLYELHEHNLAHNERFNAHIKEKLRYWELITQIGLGMRVKPVIRGLKISFVRDEKPLIANYAIGPHDTVKDTTSIEYDFEKSSEVNDGVKIEYIDADIWQHNQYELALNGNDRPKNPVVIDAMGMTNYDNVKKLTQHMVKAMRWRKNNIGFTTEKDGMFVNVGDVVDFSLAMRKNNARIVSVDGLTITVDPPIDRYSTSAMVRLDGARASQQIEVSFADVEILHSGIGNECTIFKLDEAPKVDGQIVNIQSLLDTEFADTVTFYRHCKTDPIWLRITDKSVTENSATLKGYVENMKVYEEDN